MKLEDFFRIPKHYFIGKKLHREKKEIELMSLEELGNEIGFVMLNAKKINKLDERSKDLFREYFSYGLKTDRDLSMLISTALYFDSEEVKEELFNLYFETNEIPIDFVDANPQHLINFEPTNKVKIEKVINNLKYTINDFTDKITRPFRKERIDPEVEKQREAQGFFGMQKYKPNPFKLNVSRKEEERFNQKNQDTENYIKALIYKNCVDYLNSESYLNFASTELLLKTYEILPEDEKKKFISRFINTDRFINAYRSDEELIKKIISQIPREELLEFYTKHHKKGYSWLEQSGISDEELFEYFMNQNVDIPYEFKSKFEEELTNQPFEQKIIRLATIQEADLSMVAPLSRGLTYEQLKELLSNSDISSKVKDEATTIAIFYLSQEDKIDLFKNISFDDQKKFFRSFASGIRDDEDYKEKIHQLIKNDDFKEMYRVLYKNEPIAVSEFINLVNKIDFDFEYTNNFLLSYSDEELREIYDNINNERLKYTLLRLNRKKETSSFFNRELSPELIKANEEYNKTVPDNILVNENNIEHFLETAQTTLIYSTLMSTSAFRNLSHERHLNIYKMFESQKYSIKKDGFYDINLIEKDLKNKLIYESNFIEFLQLSRDGIIDKNTYISTKNNYNATKTFNKNDILSYLQIVSEVSDLELKHEMLKTINQIFVDEKYYVSSDTKERVEDIDKINSIYKELIINSKTSIDDKYLYFGSIVNNYCLKLNITENKEEQSKLVNELKEILEKINEESGKLEYNNIFDFSLEYRFSELLGREILCTSKYSNISECLPYLNSEKVYLLIQKLYKANSGIQEVINRRFLDEKIIDSVDYEVIEYLSRYGKSFENNTYKPQELSDNKIALFIKAYNRLKSIKTYPEEYTLNLIDMIKKISDEELDMTNFEDASGNLDLIVLAALQPELAKELSEIKPQEGSNRFDEYQNSIKEKAKKEVHSHFTTRRAVLNSIGKRFFNYSYKDMRRLKKKYEFDFKTIYDSYQEKAKKQELSDEEENELKSLTIFRNISELLEIKDTQALIRVFDELDKIEEYENCNFAAMTVLEENIKRIYSRDLQNNSYKLNEDDKIETIDGIDIYSPKEFKMFVHVIAAFGEYKLVDKENPNVSSRDIWNSTKNKTNHILCTSYIGNDQMCYARWDPDEMKKINPDKDDETVIFGFGNIENTEIIMASQSDIGSRTTDLSSDESFFVSRFRLADKIIRKCRHGHNEVDLERRQKNDKEKHIEPEFIVCFDEINETSKKVAKDFNIPIVLIDKMMIAKKQSEKIDSLITNFKESKNPKLLESIINLYQCALSSFMVGKKDKSLIKEFFDPEKMNQEVRNIISIIESERKLGNKQNAEKCYLALFDALDEELKICKEEYLDPEMLSENKFHIREFRHEIKNIINKNNISRKVPKTTEEESYMYKTISAERRNKISGREDK